MLKKIDNIIASVRKGITQTTYKYGIEIPMSWDNAAKIDTKNGNRLGREALAKEMKNIGIAFDVLEAHESVLVERTKASGHLIWDLKMDFTRNRGG